MLFKRYFVKRIKEQKEDWKKTFAKHVKSFYPEYHNGLSTLTKKTRDPTQTNVRKVWVDISLEQVLRWQVSPWEGHSRHSSPGTHRWKRGWQTAAHLLSGWNWRWTGPRAGKHAGKLEFSHTAGGNVRVAVTLEKRSSFSKNIQQPLHSFQLFPYRCLPKVNGAISTERLVLECSQLLCVQ